MIDIAIELLRDGVERLDLRGQRGLAGTGLLERADAERQRGQLLAELIVHLARDAPPLVFLREDESRQQLGAGPLGICPLAFREIEVRPDDAYDGAIALPPHGIPARQHVDVMAMLVTQPKLSFVSPGRRAQPPRSPVARAACRQDGAGVPMR